jgi:RNA polymerase sigma factor (sigma-70 family)
VTNEELLERYQGGDDSALEQLYLRNTGFIKQIAVEAAGAFHCLQYQGTAQNGFTAYTEELLHDLCGEGALAFYERIQAGEYEPSKGKLTTYLYPFIKGAMYRWLEQNVGAVSLSKDEMEAVRRAQKLYFAEGRNLPEIAADMGISETAAAKYTGYNTHTLSIDDLTGNEDGKVSDPLEFLLRDRQTASADQIVYHKICLDLLQELFESLSHKDQSILGHSYGVYGYEKYSMDDLALQEILTVDGVMKARQAALERLRSKVPGSKLQRWMRANRVMRHR